MVFKTQFKNKSKRQIRPEHLPEVLVKGIRMPVELLPGKEILHKTEDPKHIYARYSQIIYKDGPDGIIEVKTKKNPNWKQFDPLKNEKWKVLLYNENFHTSVGISVNDSPISVPPGIEVEAKVPIYSPYAEYEKVIFKKEKSKPDQYDRVKALWTVKEIRIPRDKKSLEELKTLRRDVLLKRVGLDK